MRFVFGPIPPSRVLNPQTAGWIPLREWDVGRFGLIGVLLGLPFLLTAVFLLVDRPGGLRGLFTADPLLGGTFLLAVVVMTPVHELIHALAYGQDVRSPHLIVGAWPRGGLCYAILDFPMPRDRVLGMMAAPLLVLSILPLVCLPVLHGTARELVVAFCSLHTGMCGGDWIVLWYLLSQVPRKALVHNNGWQTYWNTPVTSAPFELRPAAEQTNGVEKPCDAP